MVRGEFMTKTILLILAGTLCLLGLCELLHGLWLQLCLSRGRCGTAAVVFLREETASTQISFVTSQQRWLGKSYACRIVAVDTGLSPSCREECRRAAKQAGIIFCTLSELPRQLFVLRELCFREVTVTDDRIGDDGREPEGHC